MLLGVSLIVLAFVPGILSGVLFDYDSAGETIFVLLARLVLFAGAAVLLAGVVAWVVKVGVRAARED